MIQRVQSVWLFLAAACDALTFKLPFFSGDWKRDTVQQVVPLDAKTTIWLTVIAVLTGLLAFITIFLFDNRKLQLRLSYLGIFLTMAMLTMYFLEMGDFFSGSIALWVIFYFAILACYILAARGIWKDQKLIKSMDRLR